MLLNINLESVARKCLFSCENNNVHLFLECNGLPIYFCAVLLVFPFHRGGRGKLSIGASCSTTNSSVVLLIFAGLCLERSCLNWIFLFLICLGTRISNKTSHIGQNVLRQKKKNPIWLLKFQKSKSALI